MESKNTNEVITVSNGELRQVMQSMFTEFIDNGTKNIKEMLITSFCGKTVQGNEPQPEQREAMATSAIEPSPEPVVAEVEPPAAESEAVLPAKDELVKIMSGYLHMTLSEMEYLRKDIIPIIQRLEKKVRDNDYENAMIAYKNAEKALAPIVIMGYIVPHEYHELKISDLEYSNRKIGVRIKARHLRCSGC